MPTQPNPKCLASHPGEHNARRSAMRAQAERRGEHLAALEADLIPVCGSDGSFCPGAIDFPLDYPSKHIVAAYHGPLIEAYAKAQNKARWFSADATAWDAFVAYDAAIAAADERVAA